MGAKYKAEAFRQNLVVDLVSELEKGRVPWKRAWVLPYNPISKIRYGGVNRMALAIRSMDKEYADPRWCTLDEAKASGWRIKKGEKEAYVEEESGNGPSCELNAIFNASQMDGVPAMKRKQAPGKFETVEKILTNSGAVIEHKYDNAVSYYPPFQDKIVLPAKEIFRNTEGYYNAAMHELAHWTGHRRRLNRDLSGKFGSVGYAKEELRAELASCFVQVELGVKRDVHRAASYLCSWIKLFIDKRNEIIDILCDVDKICGYIMGFADEKSLQSQI